MAVTLTKVRDTTMGNRRIRITDFTFDTSYPAGGESLTAADLRLKNIDVVIPDGMAVKSDGSLAVGVKYDYTNSKLQAFKSNTAANPQEVGDTASLDTYKVRLTAIGD